MRIYRQDIGEFTKDEYIYLLETLPQSVTDYLSRKGLVDDRKRTLVGILLAHTAAKALCGAENPTLCYTEAGKPYFSDVPMHFSISHTENLVVCVAAENNIGADIEKIRPMNTRLAARYFTEAEQAYVEADTVRFLEVWTKKEAYAKWQGEGLAAAFAVDTTSLSFYTENDGEYILSVYEGERS